MSEVRVRFAPSPTGYLHIGGARTALFNWLFARSQGGKMILRIEDTDRDRLKEDSVSQIITSLKWLGLDWDEGPEVGGDHGPYYQSERLDLYRKYCQQLVDEGKAYYCFCSAADLEAQREEQRKKKQPFHYAGTCRNLDPSEAKKRVEAGEPHSIRIKLPHDGTITVHDMIHGDVTFNWNQFDDFVIMKTNGIPTYNFAVVVDDWDMKVSHVIRGADHINNTPRQINLYKALGAEIPIFAHLPLINGPDGQKLSKRHGSVSVMEYEARGFLPEAVFNYLARLGWGHGNMEKFSREELAKVFDLSDCSRAAARIDFKKFEWLNAQYMKEADDKRLADLTRARIEKRGGKVEGGPSLAGVCGLLKTRAATLEALADAALFFYKPLERDPEAVKAALADGNKEALLAFREEAAKLATFDAPSIYGAIKAVMEKLNIKMGPIATPLRVLVCNVDRTPQIDKTLELFGKDEVLARIDSGLAMAA